MIVLSTIRAGAGLMPQVLRATGETKMQLDREEGRTSSAMRGTRDGSPLPATQAPV